MNIDKDLKIRKDNSTFVIAKLIKNEAGKYLIDFKNVYFSLKEVKEVILLLQSKNIK